VSQGFVKLYGDQLLNSTVWVTTSLETRMVWITLLLLADQHGIVLASVPGLAKQAGVSVEDVEAAVGTFTSPDRHSRSQEHEGRRLEPIDGGWLVLNYKKYREFRTIKQVKAAERQRRFREKEGVTSNARDAPEAEADTEAETETATTTALSRDRRSGERRSPSNGVVLKETGNWVSEAIKQAGAEDFSDERLLWEGRTVFSFWQYRAGKNGKVVILTTDRQSRIRRWLRIYGLEDCLLAVEGAFHHPDHNQEGRSYHELENIFKAREGAGTIEKLRDAGQRHPRQVKAIIDKLTAKGWRPSE